MSSRAWRAEGNRKVWGRITRPAIDWIFGLFGAVNHCRLAYLSDRNKAPLPTINAQE